MYLSSSFCRPLIFVYIFSSDFRDQHTPEHEKTHLPSKSESKNVVPKMKNVVAKEMQNVADANCRASTNSAVI